MNTLEYILDAMHVAFDGNADWGWSVSPRGVMYVTLTRDRVCDRFCFAPASPRALDGGAVCPDGICWLDVSVPNWERELPQFLRNRLVTFRKNCLAVVLEDIERKNLRARAATRLAV